MLNAVHALPSGALRQAEVVAEIKRRILSGQLAPGARLPPVVDWIKAFSTSPHTVQGAIAHLRRAGFVRSSKGVGNFVSPWPPHLCHFAVVFPEDQATLSIWKNNFFVAWRDEVSAYNAQRARITDGHQLSIFQECGGLDIARNNRELLHLAEETRLAGMVFVCTPVRLNDIMPRFPDLPMVTVLANRSFAMSLDLTEMLPRALDYLAQRGRKRVALLSGSLDPTGVAARIAALAAERGLATRETWIQHGNADAPVWTSRLMRLLFSAAPADRPDSLVIDNDNLVPAATQGIREAGVKVPHELEIVADTNFPHALPAHVPVRRIGYDIRSGLATAIDLIMRRRRGERTPSATLLPLIEQDDDRDNDQARDAPQT